jgi:formylglycine-generating enzyme required for sulfatase activity/serine/threonine protein kinase
MKDDTPPPGDEKTSGDTLPSVNESGRNAAAATMGDFRIVREIGRGGMGIVYEAEQISLKRRVALKVLPAYLSFSPAAVSKFLREAEAGGRQRHPGIVAVYAVGRHEQSHFIAQELVEGERTLADRITDFTEEGSQPVGYFRDIARIVADVACALQHAHESGVIHRDVKPSNILLTADDRPMVTDFGLAKIDDALALSRTGEFAGTPYYMSPEQAAGRRIGIDHRADIFSLGVTLYELLTLKRPFTGASSQEVLKKILLTEPPEPRRVNPRVPCDLAVICLKALEKRAERRYQTMTEFADDLGRFLTGDVIEAKPAGRVERLVKRIKRNPALSVAVGMVLFALMSLLVYVLWIYPRILEERNSLLRLSDSKRLSRLGEEEKLLWPECGEKVAEMKNWLRRAKTLTGRRPIHAGTLEELRLRGRPAAAERRGSGGKRRDSSTGEWLFDDTQHQWHHDILLELIAGLDAFLVPERGTIARVRKRLDRSRSIYADSIVKPAAAWNRAAASIADRAECPPYDGLGIVPQVGLVPIGRDPDSGLWEFAHLLTGVAPERGPEGKLVITEECGLVFVFVPGGMFRMGAQLPSLTAPLGSPSADALAELDEGPLRKVRIDPFFLSKYEMTQAQWLRFTGANESEYGPGSGFDGVTTTLLHPVEKVSWEMADRVLARLSLRFPSEAEWEYAARAGTTMVWWTGNEKESLAGAANLADICAKASGRPDRSYEEWLDDGFALHAPVDAFRPNPFGLHGICGNVWEWCRDRYHGSYEEASAVGAPREEGEDDKRVFRGGGWNQCSRPCRSANRSRGAPDFRNECIGLRPARSFRDRVGM